MLTVSPVSWKDLRDACIQLGCRISRTKGSHLIMTRSDLLRPVVIPMYDELGPDIVLGIVRTLGITKKELLELI